ncbi:ABC transporter permease [Kistimonas scapharcae]|uniref:ABC transporter permease n=1 Tax=Kistimonas scapharcae TaxID=1036133 RepID=A0ABP8V8Q7_9GAMM
MSLLKLACRSILNRRITALLTVVSIAISVALLLGVERIRVEAKNSFTNTISGTDLIVGARSSGINLLLYSVFHIGDATNNISRETWEDIASDPTVDWTIPVSLGDSHRGYRVVGTNTAMFEHFRHAGDQPLVFANGKAFSDLYDAVIGADVATELGYTTGQSITLAHGVEMVSLQSHDDKPFRISGILQRTGTPMDRAILISLQGIEALHVDWHNGAPPIPGLTVSADKARNLSLEPEAITAFYVGLKSRMATFRLQRLINEYPQEALLAVLPGVALQQLWQLVGVAEKALLGVAALVVLAGLTGMLTAILTSLNERRREMAILRSVGARPGHIFFLLMFESLFYALAGCLLGNLLLYGLLFVAQPLAQGWLGLHLTISLPGLFELGLMIAIITAALLLGLFPALRAYRNSLADGLTIRV